ncbi:hypothetical protein ACFOGJ_17240 [Marinibaculum pumilum]|uniref:STAS domain-containing protein n=1 Tax=Marinibaculum pumilum TaxID=1766165 RepID=A0ABV7L2Y7_9PROT
MDSDSEAGAPRTGPFGTEIEKSPDGLPDCFLITFVGEIVVSAFPMLFDRLRTEISGSELNIISDYGAATLFANHIDLLAAYRHFHENGIRLFRSVVIDADRGRPLFQSYATAVAQSVGLQADFRHVRSRAEAIETMRSMLAAPASAPQQVPGKRPPGAALDQRELAQRLGRRMDAISTSSDVEFEPGAIPNSFMIHMNRSSTAAEIHRIFVALRPHIASDTLSIVCDERAAAPEVPTQAIGGLYEELRAMGIRRYNLVVVSDLPQRHEILQSSQEVARNKGIDARFALEHFADRAVARLRHLTVDGEPSQT